MATSNKGFQKPGKAQNRAAGTQRGSTSSKNPDAKNAGKRNQGTAPNRSHPEGKSELRSGEDIANKQKRLIPSVHDR